MRSAPSRRHFLLVAFGLAGSVALARCTSPRPPAPTAAPAAAPTIPPAAAPTAAPAAATGDLNDKGWPKSIDKLTMGFIPLEDQVQQRSQLKPLVDFMSAQ